MLRQVALALTTGNTSDLINQQVTLWQGSTQVGTIQFSSANHAYGSLTGNGVLLPKAGNAVNITVKGDLAPQTAIEGLPGTNLVVKYDGFVNGLNGNYAVGASSGTTIPGTAATTTSSGLRVYRTVPTLAVTSNGGTLVSGGDLYKFVVTNPNSRDIVIDKVTFSVATTGGSAKSFTLYGDGVAANSSVADPTGVTGSQVLAVNFDDTSVARVVAANSSKTYILRATSLTPGSGTDQLSISLLQDTAWPAGIPVQQLRRVGSDRRPTGLLRRTTTCCGRRSPPRLLRTQQTSTTTTTGLTATASPASRRSARASRPDLDSHALKLTSCDSELVA